MKCTGLTSSQDTMSNEQDYVDLGLSCAQICKALQRGMDGKSLNDLSKSVCDAINQLTTWVEVLINVSCPLAYHNLDRRTVAEIQGEVLKRGGRGRVSRFLHSRDDKDVIAAWKSDLNRLLHVFNVRSVRVCLVATDFSHLKTELILNTHTIVTDIRQDVSKIREDAGVPNQPVSDLRIFYHFPTRPDLRLDSE